MKTPRTLQRRRGVFTGQNEIDTVNPYSLGVAQNGGRAPLIIIEASYSSALSSSSCRALLITSTHH